MTPLDENTAKLHLQLTRALQVDRTDRTPAERHAHLQLLAVFDRFASPAAIAEWAVTPQSEGPARAAWDLFVTFLERAPTFHERMETIVTALRKDILGRVAGGLPVPLDLCAAMATHCFFHGYIFAETETETAQIERLLREVGEEATPAAEKVAMLAAYRPLRDQAFGRRLPRLFIDHPSERLQRLLKVDVLDRLEENALRGRIERLTPVGAGVSQAVQARDEENPYPRWSYLPVSPRRAAPNPPRRSVLVAGCGTGRSVLYAAATYDDAEIWALDHSAAGLAYGLRMANAYGVEGLRFFQGDILALGALDKEFDVIDCRGVLHHLPDPEAGLAVLFDRLAPGGLLNLEVYRTHGRQAVKEAVALRERLGLGASLNDIRALRAAIYALSPGAPARGVVDNRDFFTASTCRDYLCHVQVRTYVLPELEDMFWRIGLTVARLNVPPAAEAAFRAAFPVAEPDRDLGRWNLLEEQDGNLLGGMYNLTLRKPRA